jgi:hypothetical protein
MDSSSCLQPAPFANQYATCEDDEDEDDDTQIAFWTYMQYNERNVIRQNRTFLRSVNS